MAISTRILSLCSGYGGLDLGIELCDPACRTVCYVEQESYAAANLVARMEDKTLSKAPIWDNVKTFDGAIWRGSVDCITAGYPCQPFSVAGERKGTDDPRHLWPFIRKIVEDVQPRVCFFENVANHLNMGFDEVSRDLQEMGFDVAATLVTAAEFGAPHTRERMFILALSNADGLQLRIEQRRGAQRPRREGSTEPANDCEELADLKSERRNARSVSSRNGKKYTFFEGSGGILFPPGQDPDDPDWRNWNWPSFRPTFLRGSYGSSKWVDRLRLCGNGVVPLAAAYAFGILSHDLEIHRTRKGKR